jgi:hypothetical protein
VAKSCTIFPNFRRSEKLRAGQRQEEVIEIKKPPKQRLNSENWWR